jgi:uncharacterized protein YhhL (DUF1145 family)
MFNRPLTVQRCLFRIALIGALLVYNYQHPVPMWYDVLLGLIILYHAVRLVMLMKDQNRRPRE